MPSVRISTVFVRNLLSKTSAASACAAGTGPAMTELASRATIERKNVAFIVSDVGLSVQVEFVLFVDVQWLMINLVRRQADLYIYITHTTPRHTIMYAT
jgi:hypothetical protein